MDISQRAAGLQSSLIRKIAEEGMKLDDVFRSGLERDAGQHPI